MSTVMLVIIGAAAGYIATQVMDLRTSIPATIAIGIAGALIGSVVLNMLIAIGATIAIGIAGALIGSVVLNMLIAITGWAAGFLGAVGAMALIWLWRRYAPDNEE